MRLSLRLALTSGAVALCALVSYEVASLVAIFGGWRLLHQWSQERALAAFEALDAPVSEAPTYFETRRGLKAAWRAIDLEAFLGQFEEARLEPDGRIIIKLEGAGIPPLRLFGSRFAQFDDGSKAKPIHLEGRRFNLASFRGRYRYAGSLCPILAYLDPERVEHLGALAGCATIEGDRLIVMYKTLLVEGPEWGLKPDEVLSAIEGLVTRGLLGGDLRAAFEARLFEVGPEALEAATAYWGFEAGREIVERWGRLHRAPIPSPLWLSIANAHGDLRGNIRSLIQDRGVEIRERFNLLQYASSTLEMRDPGLAFALFEGEFHYDHIHVIGHLNELGLEAPPEVVHLIAKNAPRFIRAHGEVILDFLESQWDDAAFSFIEAMLLEGEVDARVRCVALLGAHAPDLKLLVSALEGAGSGAERRAIEAAMEAVRQRAPGEMGAMSFVDEGGQLSVSEEQGGLSEA